MEARIEHFIVFPFDAAFDMTAAYKIEQVDHRSGQVTTFDGCRPERRGEEIVFDLTVAHVVAINGKPLTEDRAKFLERVSGLKIQIVRN